MIQFNEFQVVHKDAQLVIDVSVQDLSIYNDIYLSSIIIDTQDTFVEGGPSSEPVYSVTDIHGDENQNLKNYRLELTADQFSASPTLDVNKTLFFVYITTKNISDIEDVQTTLAVVYDTEIVAIIGLNHVNELSNECKIPKSFIDFILKQKALELSIETGNFTKAIKYWNSFIGNATVKPCSTGCCSCRK